MGSERLLGFVMLIVRDEPLAHLIEDKVGIN